MPDVPGADLEGVDYGVDFMKRANLGQPLEVQRRRRHRRRLHRDGLLADQPAPRRRERDDRLPADPLELVVDEEELGETEREGVRMEFLASPIEVLGEDGKVTGVKFIRNRLGEPDASGRRSPVPIEGSSSSSRPRPSSRPCPRRRT